MKYIVLLTYQFFLVACTNETPADHDDNTGGEVNTRPAAPVPEETKPAEKNNETNCYVYIAGRDTLAARFAISGEKVKGRLVYDNFQKDGSRGDFHGELTGNIIHGWYHFEAEGMKGVRELYFKKEGDDLMAGIAQEKVRGDTAYVPDASKVNYNNDMVYKKTGCENIKQLN